MLCIDTFTDNGYQYRNIAHHQIGNELACLFYLIGENDKEIENFTEYLKKKLCETIPKYLPFDKKDKCYKMTLKSDYGTYDFRYTPDGMFRMGYINIQAKPYDDPSTDQNNDKEHSLKKLSRTQIDKQTLFPLLTFNWGFHAQIAMAAGHSAKFTTEPSYSIKLAEFLRKDAEDRLISKNIDLAECIKDQILHNLHDILTTYNSIDNDQHIYSWLMHGKSYGYQQHTLEEIDSLKLINLYISEICDMYDSMLLFFSGYNEIDNRPLYENTRSVIYTKKEVLGEKTAKAITNTNDKTDFRKSDLQILFTKDEKTATKIAARMQKANTLFEEFDQKTMMNMNHDSKVRMLLKKDMLIDDVKKCMEDGIKLDDLFVENINDIDLSDNENNDAYKKQSKYFAKIMQKAIDKLPDNTISEFNKLLNNEYAENMKLNSITVQHPVNEMPYIQIKFKNVPTQQYDHQTNAYVTSEKDMTDTLKIGSYESKHTDDPRRQVLIDRLIDLYRKLYDIDNEFIRKTLKRLGLIKEGFKPVKYSEEKTA